MLVAKDIVVMCIVQDFCVKLWPSVSDIDVYFRAGYNKCLSGFICICFFNRPFNADTSVDDPTVSISKGEALEDQGWSTKVEKVMDTTDDSEFIE